MQVTINKTTLELIKGDITDEDVEVIVNAANPQLAGGGGVDGAIHRRAGVGVIKETKEKYPNGCPTGEAVITKGYNLKAKYIIHTVGPIYSGGKTGEEEKLKNAYQNSLRLAREHNLKTVSFPSISTGVYSYPLKEASLVALKSVIEIIKEKDFFDRVRFVLFSNEALEVYKESLDDLIK